MRFLIGQIGNSSSNAPYEGLLAAIVLIAHVLIIKRVLDKKKKAKRAVVVSPTHPLISHDNTSFSAQNRLERMTPIERIRDLLGPPPRTFPSSLSKYLEISPPRWMKKGDEMMGQYENQMRLRAEGIVVWATFAQANKQMFSPGAIDCGASMVYSPDPWFDSNPQALMQIASELYALKNTEQADPECAAFARMLTNERIRAMRLPVPRRISRGMKAFHTSMMLSRKHLPSGYLSSNLMPVWVDPEKTGFLMMVPAAYWPPTLLAMWDRPAVRATTQLPQKVR